VTASDCQALLVLASAVTASDCQALLVLASDCQGTVGIEESG